MGVRLFGRLMKILGLRWAYREEQLYRWLPDTAFPPTQLHQRSIIPNSKYQPTRGSCSSLQQGIPYKICVLALELSRKKQSQLFDLAFCSLPSVMHGHRVPGLNRRLETPSTSSSFLIFLRSKMPHLEISETGRVSISNKQPDSQSSCLWQTPSL